ncbi:hypothetical protein DESC_700225 [Desulfosarcina cetonica]|nr:hypothetical protein DESC_700225 [Desulfosarcina cetonica]
MKALRKRELCGFGQHNPKAGVIVDDLEYRTADFAEEFREAPMAVRIGFFLGIAVPGGIPFEHFGDHLVLQFPIAETTTDIGGPTHGQDAVDFPEGILEIVPEKHRPAADDQVGLAVVKGHGVYIAGFGADPVGQSGFGDVLTADVPGGLREVEGDDVHFRCLAGHGHGQHGRATAQVDADALADAGRCHGVAGDHRVDGGEHRLGDFVHFAGARFVKGGCPGLGPVARHGMRPFIQTDAWIGRGLAFPMARLPSGSKARW